MGHGPASVGHHGHALAFRGMPADGRIHRARILPDVPGHESDIAAMGGMVGKLAGKALVGHVVLRHHQQAAGHLIDPMDDAGPDLPADGGKTVEMKEQGVDQGPAFIAHRRMDHHAPRLVDHAQVLVLV